MLTGRNGGLQRGKRGLYRIYRCDDVGARLPENQHVDGRFPVKKTSLPDRLLRVDDVGDILQTNRAAIVITDNQRFVVDSFRNLVVGQHIHGGVSVGDLSLRGV